MRAVGALWSRLSPTLHGQIVQYILSLFLFIILFVIGYLHSTNGIDLTDEGMYISTAMRYALGDIPFRDEIMNVTRPFDVFSSLIFRIYPDISLLGIRVLGNTLHLISAFLLFILLRQYVSIFFAALICGVMFLTNNFYGISSPSYNSLSSDFALISMSLWLLSFSPNGGRLRFWNSALGGIFLAFAILCYFPLFPLLAIPLCVLMVLLAWKGDKNIAQASLIFFVSSAVVILIAGLIITFSGLLPELIDNISEITATNELRQVGIFGKLQTLFYEFLSVVSRSIIIVIVYIVASTVAVYKGAHEIVRKLFFIAVLVISFFWISPLSGVYIRHAAFILLSFSCLISLLVIGIGNWGKILDGRWKIVANVMIAWGGISSLIYGVASDGALFNAVLGITPLFAVSMTVFYRFADKKVPGVNAGEKARWKVMSYVLVVLFFVSGVNYNWKYIYRDAAVENLTQRFGHYKLVGIYTTPQRFEAIEELLFYLEGKVKPWDYFLAYNSVPLLYFLTNTRPAYKAAWARDDWPLPIRERLVKEMVAGGRTPEYCVRMLVIPSENWNEKMPYAENSPLNSYIASNYHTEKIIYPFEVLHKGVPELCKTSARQGVVNITKLPVRLPANTITSKTLLGDSGTCYG